MYEEIVRLENITKIYSKKRLFENINLTVKRGTSIALMGHNGAGKSTLLKIISGLTSFNSGKIIHNGRIKFNYIPEHFPKLNISAKQYIECMGRIENIPLKELKHKYEELFHNFHIDTMLDIPIKHLSKGSLQKVSVIQAFLQKPDVLLLDEPLSGQDIQSQRYFIQYVNQLKAQGVAIVMSCHEIFLINQLSDNVYMIDDCNLNPVNADHVAEENFDILCFDNSKNRKVPEKFLEYINKIEYDEFIIRLIVENKKSNIILFKMLEEGFLLRSMRGMEY